MRTIREAVEEHAIELARQVWPEGKAAPQGNGEGEWHVVHCVGKTDQFALDWLKERKFETYYPMLRELKPVPKDQLSKKQRASGVVLIRPRLVPCLPRYVFVRFDMGRNGWREIFDFAGIDGLVCAGGLPVRITEAEIACMQNTEVDGAIPGPTMARLVFAEGQRVRVKEGPFAEFPGIVEVGLDIPLQELDSDTRIRVAVNIFGRPTPVDLAVTQVDKF